ncbi:transmembrane protease serine 11D-like [Plodia interpunctella]|uniref:transmembrane protease serine 11D-like n=1 Tax=Plodia interpunctella TaxID=58824 RepID=UPI0023686448|nr:transmembrane protease serine 11D-like [Plodia interpunctella]
MSFSIILGIVILGVHGDNNTVEYVTTTTVQNENVTITTETNTQSIADSKQDISILLPNRNVNDLAKVLVKLLKTDGNEKRMDELQEKLDKIEQYVLDKIKFADLLRNVTKESDLNSTVFYKSLKQDDNSIFLAENDTKNLYLKLKENMNRDDILRIIAERGNKKKIVKYARRMMQEDIAYNGKKSKDIINAVVDKILAETPNDEHKFDYKTNSSKYWDPKIELEELQEYHANKLSGRRLFRGVRTTVRYYPFMVSVHVAGRFWCGGVIYWHDLILTSASCLQLMHNNRFYRENPKILSVRVGSNHSRIGGEEIDAVEVYFHPAYNPRTLRNNIALIRIRYHLYFSYHRIPKIIEISTYPHGIASTSEVMLLGWGVTKMSQKLSYEPIYLQRKFLPVYPNSFCKEVYGDKFITSTMFCAGTMTTGEGACDHDAGGPAILGGKLVGIISFGPTVCGFPNAPTVFTLVGAYSDWIKHVNESMPQYYRGKKYTTSTTRHMVFSYLATLLHLHTSTTEAPPPPPLPPPTTTEPPPPPTPEPKEEVRKGREIFDDSEELPRHRIPPPVFKLTKNSKKKKKFHKDENQDFDIDVSD